MAAMSAMMEGMMETGPAPSGGSHPPPLDPGRFAEGFTSVMASFTYAFIAIWLLAKTALCALAIRYLRKPEIRARFGAA